MARRVTARPIREVRQRLTDAIGGIGAAGARADVVGSAGVCRVVRAIDDCRQPTLPRLIAAAGRLADPDGGGICPCCRIDRRDRGLAPNIRRLNSRMEERRERRANDAARQRCRSLLSELSDYATRCADVFAVMLDPPPFPIRPHTLSMVIAGPDAPGVGLAGCAASSAADRVRGTADRSNRSHPIRPRVAIGYAGQARADASTQDLLRVAAAHTEASAGRHHSSGEPARS